ncbi:MAG TPA: pectinesterase family protein [Ignavibacteriales bacterium]|nr:pectinesterase family protein [Ignavibacteriales bacterium]
MMKHIPLILIFLFAANFAYGYTPNLIVAKDGSGDFTSIQAALNAAPDSSGNLFVIFIKNGIYKEKLFIEKSSIALVGESRDSCRIIYAELRKNWNAANNGEDYGSAVINLKDGVRDIIFRSLTVHNNYGGLYSDHDHQFAIRGRATRIIIVDCNIIADGGDTLSLWNKEDGMYYHKNCYFEGWVDFVCPRGWCYITDSRFYGHNMTAAIWHDGDSDKDQKLVIRNSYFDGRKGFPLGRHHREAQFYLLDCRFSNNMADKPIFQAPAKPPRVLEWGERNYFHNCHGDSVDYAWHADNLDEAAGSPKPEDITPEWTFKGKWDPEAVLKNFYEN